MGRRLRFVVYVVAGFAAVLTAANLVGKRMLERTVNGTDCAQTAAPDEQDFWRGSVPREQYINRARVRTLATGPRPTCTRIGKSYRCEVGGPTVVEVRYPETVQYFDIPAGSRAVLYGGNRTGHCKLAPGR